MADLHTLDLPYHCVAGKTGNALACARSVAKNVGAANSNVNTAGT